MISEQAARERLIEYQKSCQSDETKLAVSRSHTRVALHHSAEVTENQLQQCFNLVKTTSAADYRASSMGWHPKSKKKEMKDSDMWYMLVEAESADESSPPLEKVVGFLSFMITYDDPPHDDRLVVYVYEIHLANDMRGEGLGKHLMATVRELTAHCGISKIMLTVFTKNTWARDFYEHLGFTKDQCSPPDREVRGRIICADYMILSTVFH